MAEKLCLIMDFDGGSWDIAVDAESLHESLFGNLTSHDNEHKVIKKGKKRKHNNVSGKTEHKKFKGGLDMKKVASENQDIETKQKKKTKKLKQKSINYEHKGEGSELRNVVEIPKLQFNESSDGSDRKTRKDIDQPENAVKKKKKRKRKCKKNKFKDYSKPDSSYNGQTVVDGHNTLQLQSKSNVSTVTETDRSNNKMKDVIQKKKKMKLEKKLDSNTVENNVDENDVKFKDRKYIGLSNETESSVKGKKKKKHKTKMDKVHSVSHEDKADMGHSAAQQLPVDEKDNNVTQDKMSTKSGLDSKKKKKKKRESEENNSSFKSAISSEKESNNIEHESQENRKASVGKKNSVKNKGNQFDPEKLQAILKNKVQMKSSVDTSNDTSNAKGKNEFDKTKAKKITDPVPETLLEKSRRKLNAARFRYLNEQLYTTTGSEAFQMFKNDKEAFQVYHDGFQGQVEKWPVNPVDIIIADIKSKPKNLVVADFGCGDAKIAQNVPNKVHSFDLVALNHHVTVCDISKVPLPDSSVDIAVFCLSLMGTNLSSYLQQANRVLKKNGILKIAEVSSRFTSTGRFVLEVEKMGFKIIKQDTSNKMFLMMDFKKTGSAKSPVADIRLDPCVYKKR